MQRRGDVEKSLAAQARAAGAPGAAASGARLHGLQAERERKLGALRAQRDTEARALHSPVTLRRSGGAGSGSAGPSAAGAPGSTSSAMLGTDQLYRRAEELQRKRAKQREAQEAEAREAAMPRINACVRSRRGPSLRIVFSSPPPPPRAHPFSHASLASAPRAAAQRPLQRA